MSEEQPPTGDGPPTPSPKEMRKQAKSALRAAEERQKNKVRDATRALEAAQKTHSQTVKQAESAVSDAEKAYASAVSDAEKRAEAVEQGRAIAACPPYTLFDDRVYTPEGAVWLVPGLTASVDTSGAVQVEHHPTATRCCCLGIFALGVPKKDVHDTRQLYITIAGPGVSTVGAVPPNMERTARELVAALNVSASRGPEARKERESAAREAARELDAARADRRAIDDATARLESTRAGAPEVAAAETALAEAQADTTEVDAARKRLEDLERGS